MSGLRLVSSAPQPQPVPHAPVEEIEAAPALGHLLNCPMTCTPAPYEGDDPWRMAVCVAADLLRTKVLNAPTTPGVLQPKGARMLAQSVLIEQVGETVAKVYIAVIQRHTPGPEPRLIADTDVRVWSDLLERSRLRDIQRSGAVRISQEEAVTELTRCAETEPSLEESEKARARAEWMLMSHVDQRLAAVYGATATVLGWHE